MRWCLYCLYGRVTAYYALRLALPVVRLVTGYYKLRFESASRVRGSVSTEPLPPRVTMRNDTHSGCQIRHTAIPQRVPRAGASSLFCEFATQIGQLPRSGSGGQNSKFENLCQTMGMDIANTPACETLYASEVAECLGVNRGYAYRLMRNGVIKGAFQLVNGGVWMVSRADLETFVATRRPSR
jgi:excisionase family DNA binding protein